MHGAPSASQPAHIVAVPCVYTYERWEGHPATRYTPNTQGAVENREACRN